MTHRTLLPAMCLQHDALVEISEYGMANALWRRWTHEELRQISPQMVLVRSGGGGVNVDNNQARTGLDKFLRGLSHQGYVVVTDESFGRAELVAIMFMWARTLWRFLGWHVAGGDRPLGKPDNAPNWGAPAVAADVALIIPEGWLNTEVDLANGDDLADPINRRCLIRWAQLHPIRATPAWLIGYVVPEGRTAIDLFWTEHALLALAPARAREAANLLIREIRRRREWFPAGELNRTPHSCSFDNFVLPPRTAVWIVMRASTTLENVNTG